MGALEPRFPLYIPSKGRHDSMLTSKALTAMGAHHHIVVESQEMDLYRKAVERWSLKATLLELDMSYKERYELCDKHGLSKSTGSGPARNFAWEHSMSQGHERHWLMDDNIRNFRRLYRGYRVLVKTKLFWRMMEDFVLQYKNVAMAGPQYNCFAIVTSKRKPFILNTRIYSCNLIKNNVPYRWRGRYNEDTILSLDMLKGGWCTIAFYAFLAEKMGTQTMKGGNTDELYAGEKVEGQKYAVGGTDEKSLMLQRVHPDVARVACKYGRVHHHVNYKVFRQKLIRDPDAEPIPDYGLVLKPRER